METAQRVCSLIDLEVDRQNHSETTNSDDKNTPSSPGEVQTMRNHTKIASKLYSSPSRKASKPNFTIHGSRQNSPKLGKEMTSSGRGSSLEKRKTLQVLQPAADGKGLVGTGGVIKREKKRSSKSKTKTDNSQRTLVNKLDDITSTTTESSDSDSSTGRNTKTDVADASNEAFALMVQDPPPEKYWQLVAEERRVALQEALEENEKLQKKLEAMTDRCSKLEEVAGQAEYFASLYSMVMEGEAPDLDESDSSPPTEHNQSSESNHSDI